VRKKLSAIGSQPSAGKRREANPRRSTVRILAGKWKGRRLDVPAGAHPTSGRAREALFDILQRTIPGSRVLDLFAGSGAVGIEALSRGAARAVFVEKDAGGVTANLARLGAGAGEALVVEEDAGQAAASLARRGEEFDVVFADPPYAFGETALSRSVVSLLAPGGTLVVQTDSGERPPALPGVAPLGRRAYGRNVFWFFEGPAEPGD
jgi:16S rRNA (guanine(966)-N(2))-methyltransferase RsmD